MADIIRWPKDCGALAPLPQRIDKAADYGLLNAVNQMENQWGSIETYNRLIEHCLRLKAQIDAGQAKAINPCVDASWHRTPISHLQFLTPLRQK